MILIIGYKHITLFVRHKNNVSKKLSLYVYTVPYLYIEWTVAISKNVAISDLVQKQTSKITSIFIPI